MSASGRLLPVAVIVGILAAFFIVLAPESAEATNVGDPQVTHMAGAQTFTVTVELQIPANEHIPLTAARVLLGDRASLSLSGNVISNPQCDKPATIASITDTAGNILTPTQGTFGGYGYDLVSTGGGYQFGPTGSSKFSGTGYGFGGQTVLVTIEVTQCFPGAPFDTLLAVQVLVGDGTQWLASKPVDATFASSQSAPPVIPVTPPTSTSSPAPAGNNDASSSSSDGGSTGNDEDTSTSSSGSGTTTVTPEEKAANEALVQEFQENFIQAYSYLGFTEAELEVDADKDGIPDAFEKYAFGPNGISEKVFTLTLAEDDADGNKRFFVERNGKTVRVSFELDLAWTNQGGEDVYKIVWRANSPYQAIAILPPGVDAYADVNSPDNSVYKISFAFGQEMAEAMAAGEPETTVPGWDVHEGTTPTAAEETDVDDEDTGIPAVGVVGAIGALGALALVRRRL